MPLQLQPPLKSSIGLRMKSMISEMKNHFIVLSASTDEAHFCLPLSPITQYFRGGGRKACDLTDRIIILCIDLSDINAGKPVQFLFYRQPELFISTFLTNYPECSKEYFRMFCVLCL